MTTLLTQPETHALPLCDSIKQSVRGYLDQLEGQMPIDLYKLVLEQMEVPLLEVVLEHFRGNQVKTARAMGLNRGTLRKKMKQYNMLRNRNERSDSQTN